jgi:hypothetical protein
MIKSKLRGRTIYYNNGEWFYLDNNEPTANNRRNCGHCNLPDREDDIDPCLGKLPGVANACCGHGNPKNSYVQFENKVTIRGFKKDN